MAKTLNNRRQKSTFMCSLLYSICLACHYSIFWFHFLCSLCVLEGSNSNLKLYVFVDIFQWYAQISDRWGNNFDGESRLVLPHTQNKREKSGFPCDERFRFLFFKKKLGGSERHFNRVLYLGLSQFLFKKLDPSKVHWRIRSLEKLPKIKENQIED